MNKNKFIFLAFGIALCILSCDNNTGNGEQISVSQDSFSFVFMTDAHLEYQGDALKYFGQAIDTVNKIKPDFVITGGDLVRDVNNVRETYADSLFNLYLSEIQKFDMPVYSTIGNHEITGLRPASDVMPNNPMYGKGMFENKIGKRFSSFEHKGWKFFMLDDLQVMENERRIVGHFDEEQMEWLKNELAKTDTLTPIVVSCHIALITAIRKFQIGSMAGTEDFSAVDNSKEFLDLFKHHKLKLVLQGHEHFLEVLYAMDIYFVTGSSVSGTFVKPPDTRGMVQFHISGNDISWKFIANQ